MSEQGDGIHFFLRFVDCYRVLTLASSERATGEIETVEEKRLLRIVLSISGNFLQTERRMSIIWVPSLEASFNDEIGRRF